MLGLNIRNHTLDEQNLDQTCPFAIGSHQLEPAFDLGRRERLPYELIAEITAQLNLRSLFDFRLVNQRAMQAVDAVPRLKQILKHNLSALRSVLAVQAGSYLSCVQLLRTLRTANCEHCGDFAGYIYALDCTRVCFLCFTENTRYLPPTALQLLRDFGVNQTSLPGLPLIQSLPGHHTPNDNTCSKSLTLYDRGSAKRAGIALHGSQAAIEQFAAETFSRKIVEYENRATEKRQWPAYGKAPKTDQRCGGARW